ncbi:MAG: peptidoglycan bridge formation glycyltransferase FemA/FemB family protein [Thermonemataceae bacterium]|nr:peptidoglycan bridge formation glycyltransferase FemA/FemB family protein [Thermonemataceae bacterium]
MEMFAEPLEVFRQKKMNYTFEQFLFCQNEHIFLQQAAEVIVFYASKKSKIVARINFFITNGAALSPLKMSFGGLELASELAYQDVFTFLTFVERIIQEKKLVKIHISAPPFCYQTQQAELVSQILLAKNYQIKNAEIGHFIEVNRHNFQQRLHISEQRRLKKLKKNGFFVELNPDLSRRFIYEFIKKARERKNFPISMSFENFEKTLQLFPEKYLVFVVKKEEQIAAISVAIMLNENILYNFYPADNEDFLSFSPTIMLNEALYEYAQKNNFGILDLGVSTDRSQPNFGLIRFKENLGAKSSLKLSFEKYFLV